MSVPPNSAPKPMRTVLPQRHGTPGTSVPVSAGRVVRYADDFVVLVHDTEADTAALREEIADPLEPLGLRLSRAKTRTVHMSDGFDFQGFRIQWKRKGGTTNGTSTPSSPSLRKDLAAARQERYGAQDRPGARQQVPAAAAGPWKASAATAPASRSS
ncbi:hypothetical protein [Streptomyces sp. NBC_01727]|uniref:hypothetical protein n=1 Tax=Streptomyces sp. NBC_01727 TaxID=2975924 RepID=UPI003FA3B013